MPIRKPWGPVTTTRTTAARPFDGQVRHTIITVIRAHTQPNADDLGSVEPYLPTRGPATVLVTTRDRGDHTARGVGVIVPVGGLDPATAAEFLTRRTGMNPADARTIAAGLGGLPLALAVVPDPEAGGLSRESGAPAAGSPPSEGPLVERVIRLAIDDAERRHPSSLLVLQALSVLNPDGTSPEILAEVAGSPDPGLLQGLVAAGLLVGDAEERLVIHRLTGQLIRELDPKATDHAIRQAASHLTTMITQRRGPAPRLTSVDQEIMLHTEALLNILDPHPTATTATAVVALANRAVTMLNESGDVTTESRMANLTAARADEVLDPDHPEALTARANLASLQGRAGNPASAAAAFEVLLTDALRVLGPDHPDTLTTRGNLARWRGEAGDTAGAAAAAGNRHLAARALDLAHQTATDIPHERSRAEALTQVTTTAAAYEPDLARSLNTLSNRLKAVGRDLEAEQARQDARTLRR